MRVTRHYSHKQILHDYTLHQQTLENVQSAKCLGISVTENIDWGQYISDISDVSSRAIKTLSFLRRNLDFAPRSTQGGCMQNFGSPLTGVCSTLFGEHFLTQEDESPLGLQEVTQQ